MNVTLAAESEAASAQRKTTSLAVRRRSLAPCKSLCATGPTLVHTLGGSALPPSREWLCSEPPVQHNKAVGVAPRYSLRLLRLGWRAYRSGALLAHGMSRSVFRAFRLLVELQRRLSEALFSVPPWNLACGQLGTHRTTRPGPCGDSQLSHAFPRPR